MEKQANVLKCTYDKPWVAKDGAVMHYHVVELDNGDIGKVCTADKMPDKISPGAEITYSINGQSIKLTSFSTPQAPTPPKPIYNKPTYNNQYQKSKTTTTPGASSGGGWKNAQKKPEDYLGFVFGYAKDITCKLIEVGNKGAISKPVELTNKMAEEFYVKIKQLLNEEPTNPE